MKTRVLFSSILFLGFCLGSSPVFGSNKTFGGFQSQDAKKEARIDSVFDSKDLDTWPEPIGGPAAIQQRMEYPEKARKSGIQGMVIVECLVNDKGDVVSTKILRGIGGGCDESAARAVRLTKFKPAIFQGRAVSARINIPLRFRVVRKG